MLAHPDVINKKDIFIKLWIHECRRVFRDKLTNEEDFMAFDSIIVEILESRLGITTY